MPKTLAEKHATRNIYMRAYNESHPLSPERRVQRSAYFAARYQARKAERSPDSLYVISGSLPADWLERPSYSAHEFSDRTLTGLVA